MSINDMADGRRSASVEGEAMAERDDWSSTRTLVILLCFALNMLDGTDLLIMSFVAPVLADQWQISPERLGVLFSASLAGMAVGCLMVAPLGDRFGRRSMIIVALTSTATAMLASGFASQVSTLMVCRALVGIGVGTIGVTMTTMAAEYATRNRAHLAVSFVQAGWPFASVLAAVCAARLLPAYGWRGLFLGIGCISLVLLLLIVLFMPESLSYLETRQPVGALARINDVRRRLGLRPRALLSAKNPAAGKLALNALFREGRGKTSAILWAAVTLGYFDLYFVISWIPKLATQAGLPLTQAIYAGGTYNLGAFVGTSAVGWIASRWRLDYVIACYFAAATVAMLVFGGVAMPVWATLVMAFLVGLTVQGGFNGFWALAAKLYPAAIRNTGVGWALGVGRIGAVLGPIVGGILLGLHIPLAAVFAIFAVPLAVTASLVLKLRVS